MGSSLRGTDWRGLEKNDGKSTNSGHSSFAESYSEDDWGLDSENE
jgi:hypothetical protein